MPLVVIACDVNGKQIEANTNYNNFKFDMRDSLNFIRKFNSEIYTVFNIIAGELMK